MIASEKQWTNGELIDELSKYPRNAKVKLTDADTMWTVPEFSVYELDGEVWFDPCSYEKMES